MTNHATEASTLKTLVVRHHTALDTHDLEFENHHNVGWMFVYPDYLMQQYVTTVAL
jgi:hypothetical protein